jgi:ribosomal protein L37AE/L43A
VSLGDLIPFLLLGAVALGIGIVRAGPGWLAIAALGAILAVVVGWIVTSVLWPGRADRVCPACGAEAVRRTAPGALVGRRCASCDWRDDAESAWMMAEEEEDALEPLVLRGRGGAVDTRATAD